MSTVIEIQTIEGGRLEWVAICSDSNKERAIEWGDRLLMGVHPKPFLRVTDGLRGAVIGAWQKEGYEAI